MPPVLVLHLRDPAIVPALGSDASELLHAEDSTPVAAVWGCLQANPHRQAWPAGGWEALPELHGDDRHARQLVDVVKGLVPAPGWRHDPLRARQVQRCDVGVRPGLVRVWALAQPQAGHLQLAVAALAVQDLSAGTGQGSALHSLREHGPCARVDACHPARLWGHQQRQHTRAAQTQAPRVRLLRRRHRESGWSAHEAPTCSRSSCVSCPPAR